MRSKATTMIVALALVLAPAAWGASLAVDNNCALGLENGGMCGGDGRCGLAVTFLNDSTAASVRDDTPTEESVFRMAFWYQLNTVAMNDGSFHVIYRATDVSNGPASAFQILQNHKNGLWRVWLRIVTNTGATKFTSRINLDPNQPSRLQVEYTTSDTPGVANGDVTLSVIDGFATGQSTSIIGAPGLNNSLRTVDNAIMGAVGNVNVNTSGTACYDTYESFRTLAP